MFFNEWITENIFVYDSNNFTNLKISKGHSCFIIGHHVKDKIKIQKISNLLLEKGYEKFFVFGEQALLWTRILYKYTKNNPAIRIEASKIANEELAYNLAFISEEFPKLDNLVISDDFYFTEYLVKDYENIIKGEYTFSVNDWKKFRQGFEFQYNNKDCILSINDGILIGFLGKEKLYPDIVIAFKEEIFDGHSFEEIWDDIRPNDNNYK